MRKVLSYSEHYEAIRLVNLDGVEIKIWMGKGVHPIPDGYDFTPDEKKRWNGIIHWLSDSGGVQPLLVTDAPVSSPVVHTIPQKEKSGTNTKLT